MSNMSMFLIGFGCCLGLIAVFLAGVKVGASISNRSPKG
jgi:hypothetical protein